MVSLNSLNSVIKIDLDLFIITVKGFEPANSCAKRLGCYHSTSKTHTRNKIFKLPPNHAFVILSISLNSVNLRSI